MTRATLREVVLFKPDALNGATSIVHRSRATDLLQLLQCGLPGRPGIQHAQVRHDASREAARHANRRIAVHAVEHSWYVLEFENLETALANLGRLEGDYSKGEELPGVRGIGLDLCNALGFEIVASATFLVTEERFNKMYHPSDIKVPRRWLTEYFVGNTCEAVVLQSTGGTNTLLQIAKEYLRGVLQAGSTEYLPTVMKESDENSRRLSNYLHVCDPGAHEADYLAALVAAHA